MIGGPCQAPVGGGFVSGVLDFVDCQAQAIGLGGYQALAAPGSALSLALSILLTLFVALFGYRLLLGERLGLRDGALAVIKIGIVFTLAFSWSAYRALIYDVAFRAPAEIASDIGRPAGLPGADGGLVARLDQADRAFISLQMLGAGAGTVSPASTLQAGTTPPQTASAFDPLALGGARVFYLTSALGAFAGMRMIAGLMLGLGPFFIGFLLFESTRGLFEGWIRVLAGAALGALGTAIILGVQLALLETRLAELVAWRTAGYAIPGAPAELLVISLVFALANLAMLIGVWRLTGGFAFPAMWRSTLSRVADNLGAGEKSESLVRTVPSAPAGERSRTAALAESITTIQRREALEPAGPDRPYRIAQPHVSRVDDPPPEGTRPLGQTGRRTVGRISASALRRDRR